MHNYKETRIEGGEIYSLRVLNKIGFLWKYPRMKSKLKWEAETSRRKV